MEASAHFFLSSVEVALTLPFHISSAKAWDALQRKCHCESLLALSKERRITIGPEPGRRANMRTLHTVCRRPGWRAQNRGETAAYLNPSGSRHRPGTELPDPGAPEGSVPVNGFRHVGSQEKFSDEATNCTPAWLQRIAAVCTEATKFSCFAGPPSRARSAR